MAKILAIQKTPARQKYLDVLRPFLLEKLGRTNITGTMIVDILLRDAIHRIENRKAFYLPTGKVEEVL